MALLAVQVGEELDLSPGRVRSLATLALVHDIGKLSVPDSILKKPGPLTDEEFSVVKRHSEWGDVMLGDLGFGRDVRQLVRDHHERLDARATRMASPTRPSRSTRGSSRSATSTTRSSQRAFIERRGRTSAPLRFSARSGSSFDPKCVAALESVLAREGSSESIAV